MPYNRNFWRLRSGIYCYICGSICCYICCFYSCSSTEKTEKRITSEITPVTKTPPNDTSDALAKVPFSSSSIANKSEKQNHTITKELSNNSTLTPLAFKHLAEEVLHHLLTTINGQASTQLEIRIVQNDSLIAQYLPGSQVIELGASLFSVCQSMGKDSLAALAFVIGHELAHFFQNQKQLDKTSCPFLAYDLQYAAIVREEKAADVHGIFVAYLAGYLRTGDIVPEIINKIYTAFNLENKKLPQYDPLPQRMAIAEEVKKKADTLRHVYDLGNFCTLSGNYPIASACYEYILQFYQGAEIYNNLALAKIHEGMTIGDKRIDPFLYPLELDIQTKLSRVRADTEIANTKELEKRKLLFQEAANYLEKAILKNPGYLHAKLNKLCLLSLSGKPEKAIPYFKSISSVIPTSREKDRFQLALAIAYLQSDTPALITSGQSILETLSLSEDNFLAPEARYNLEVFRNTEWVPMPSAACPFLLSHNILTKESNQFQLYPTIPVFQLNPNVKIGWSTTKEATRWVGKWKNEDRIRLVQLSKNLSVEKVEAIKKNTDNQMLDESKWTFIRDCGLLIKPKLNSSGIGWDIVLLEN